MKTIHPLVVCLAMASLVASAGAQSLGQRQLRKWRGFMPAEQIQVGNGLSITSADLNADGYPDFVLGSAGGTTLLSTGPKTYAAPVDNPVPGVGFGFKPMLADYDFDGDIDLAFLTPGPSPDFTLHVLTNAGDGSLSLAGQFPVLVSTDLGNFFQVLTSLATDMNGDGAADIAVSTTIGGLAKGDGQISVIINNTQPGGPLSFANSVTFPTTKGTSRNMVAQDFDNDGDQDLVLSQVVDSSITVFLNDGDGVNGVINDLRLGGKAAGYTAPMALGDVNGDGYVDIIHLSDDSLARVGLVQVLLNLDGGIDPLLAGTFRKSTEFAFGSDPTTIFSDFLLFEDFDLDGRGDVVGGFIGSSSPNTFMELVPFAGRLRTLAPGFTPEASVAVDLEADGDLDIVTATDVGQPMLILRNPGKQPTFGRR